MKFYNVHIVDASKLQALLNTHATKGYEIRWFRNVGGNNVQVVFEQEAEARLKRRVATGAATKEPDVESVAP